MATDPFAVPLDSLDPLVLQRQLALVIFEQWLTICLVAANPYSWVPDYCSEKEQTRPS